MTETRTIRERQAPLKAMYQSDPSTARQITRVFSTTTGNDPMRVQIGTDAGDARLNAVAHPAVGGYDDTPCSGDLLIASYAACQEITLRLVAVAMGITLDKVELTVEGEWDVRGTLGVDREAPVGYTKIHTTINVVSDAPEEQVKKLLARYERYCVVGATLRTPPEITTSYTIEPASTGGDQG
ncbi:MAG: OsmC family protein [Thermomicrobiales bacterium]|nr:OsmC family protein [Thermomicrobiales bacterium]